MTALTHSRYSPARGGHAPGDLRSAFQEAFDAYYESPADGLLPTVELRGRTIDLRALTGLLWNCRDIAPASFCRSVADLALHIDRDGFERGGKTYAQCARVVRNYINRDGW